MIVEKGEPKVEIDFKKLIDALSGICEVKEGNEDPCEEAEPDHPYDVGKCYFVRTVTMYYVGRLVRVTSQELVLFNVSWVADTGRFSDALKSGLFLEVESFPSGNVIVGRGSIVDVSEWAHELPRESK